jgi:hypothetical protein
MAVLYPHWMAFRRVLGDLAWTLAEIQRRKEADA